MRNQKLLLILMLGIFIVFQSCEKKELVPSGELQEVNKQFVAEGEEWFSEIDVEYLFNEGVVKTNPFELKENKSLEIKNIIVVLEPIVKGKKKKITINSFDTDKAYIEWGIRRGIPVADMLEKEAIIKKFIEDNNVKEIFEKTGKIPENYIKFEEELLNTNKVASPLFIFKSWYGGGAWSVANSMPSLKHTTWNNAISRYYDHAGYGGTSWYDGTWYKYRMATLWDFGWHNVRFYMHLSYLDNKTSSLINW